MTTPTDQPRAYGQQVPPPGYPPQFYGPPQQPRRRNWWGTTPGILTIVGLALLPIAACGGLVAIGMISDRNGAAKMDASLTNCEFESGAIPSVTVEYTVTNRGDSTRTARLKLEYQHSDGARIDTDTAVVRDIRPGGTVRGEEITLLDGPPLGSSKCVLVGIE